MVFSQSTRKIITVLNRPGAPVWGRFWFGRFSERDLAFPEGAQSGAAISGATSALAAPEAAEATRAVSLAQAVGITLEKNRELNAVRFEHAMSEQAIREAESAFWPQLSFQGTYRSSCRNGMNSTCRRFASSRLVQFRQHGIHGGELRELHPTLAIGLRPVGDRHDQLANLQEEALPGRPPGKSKRWFSRPSSPI